MNSGSAYPIIGDIIAWSTRGLALLGPGPRRIRGGITGTFDSGTLLILSHLIRAEVCLVCAAYYR